MLKYSICDAGENQIETAEGLLSCNFPFLETLELESNYITNITFLYRLLAPRLK
jgi:hypothetical protein